MAEIESPKPTKTIRFIAPLPDEYEEFAKCWFIRHATYPKWLLEIQRLRARLPKLNRSVTVELKMCTIPLAALRKMLADLGMEMPTCMDERIIATDAIVGAGFLELEEELQIAAIVTGFGAQAIGKPRRE